MIDQNKMAKEGMVNHLNNHMDTLKMVMRNVFKTIYTDKWKREEERWDSICREIKAAYKNGDGKRLTNSIKEMKEFFMMDDSGNSNKLSDANLKSYMNNSNGRYYGAVFVEFINFLKKVDSDFAGNSSGNLPTNITSERNEFTNSSNNSQSKNAQSNSTNLLIIENPISGDRIKVAIQDFERIMDWEDANVACRSLGNGWRLPTKLELNLMYKQLYLKGLGAFRVGDRYAYYWSSEERDSYKSKAYFFRFDHEGKHYHHWKSSNCYVRAVRTL